jgi:hypothetical protein
MRGEQRRGFGQILSISHVDRRRDEGMHPVRWVGVGRRDAAQVYRGTAEFQFQQCEQQVGLLLEVAVETAGRQLSLFEHTLDFESPPAAAVEDLPGRGEELGPLALRCRRHGFGCHRAQCSASVVGPEL